jgi:hypothetical protein
MHIAQQVTENSGAANFTTLLLDLALISKCQPRSASRFFPGHSVLLVPIDQQSQVMLQFLVDVCLNRLAAEKSSETGV